MAPRHRVLAVDDNARNLSIIELSIAGEFELVTAASGAEALELAPRIRPGVILLDIMMPGMDGYETCRRLRAIPALRTCKIIMVSARAATTDRLDGYDAGADDFLSKPFDPDELVAKLRVYHQLKKAEELDRLRSDLLHLIAHETRTPLNSVLTPAGMLLQDGSLTGDQRAMVDMIQRGGARLLALVEKVTYWNDLKHQQLDRIPVTLEADRLVQRAVDALAAGREESWPGLDLEFEPGLTFEADPDQLHTVVSALLDNALRLTPATGRVRVRAYRERGWAVLEVRDEGPGMTADLRDRIFEGFVVADVRTHSRGHGLSLAIARMILEQHDGTLEVRSEPGAGATFTLRLPTAGPEARVA